MNRLRGDGQLCATLRHRDWLHADHLPKPAHERTPNAGIAYWRTLLARRTEACGDHPNLMPPNAASVGHSTELAFGQRVYTIGNPSGLAYTVTSGVFSGERGEGHQRLLQTDAAINPGNSGHRSAAASWLITDTLCLRRGITLPDPLSGPAHREPRPLVIATIVSRGRTDTRG
jgi:hypothetical protein